MFAAQVDLVRNTYGIQPGEVDLPLLPVFALFNPALGTTTIVPEIDPSNPGAFDPARAVQAILQEGVTYSFGSPTLWGKIAWHCQRTQQTLPSLRRVLSAGAPVPPWLWQAMQNLLPNGTLHSPYGATEALPVSSIGAHDVLNETAAATLTGAGTCVGNVLSTNQVKIVAITDKPISTLNEIRELPAGSIGEIIVNGPTVTREYDQLPTATTAAKIQSFQGTRPGFPSSKSTKSSKKTASPFGRTATPFGRTASPFGASRPGFKASPPPPLRHLASNG